MVLQRGGLLSLSLRASAWAKNTPAVLPAEVNAVEWTFWGLVNSKGTLRYPGFPPVAYVQMEASQGSGGALCSGWAVVGRPAGILSCAPTLLVPAGPPLNLLHTRPGHVLT